MQGQVRHYVTVIGEALIDLVPAGDPLTFRARQGGSPLNVAVGLARLGIPTSMMARLGDNSLGRVLRGYLQAESVDIASSPGANEPTTLAVVSLDDDGNAIYEFYTEGTADWQWTREELDRLPARTTILHFGSISSWTDPGWIPILEAANRAHISGQVLVSYDPNVRPALCGDRAQATSRVEGAVSSSHLVKVSGEDLAWLYPGADTGSIAQHWVGLGPDLVVVTDGLAGARAYNDRGLLAAQPGRQVAVADTVGAGDSFSAALLAALAEVGAATPIGLGHLGVDAVESALRFAVLASSITCTRVGANPPTSAEMAEAIGT